MRDDRLGLSDNLDWRIFTDFTFDRFEYRGLQVLLHAKRWKRYGNSLYSVELDCISWVACRFLPLVTHKRLVRCLGSSYRPSWSCEKLLRYHRRRHCVRWDLLRTEVHFYYHGREGRLLSTSRMELGDSATDATSGIGPSSCESSRKTLKGIDLVRQQKWLYSLLFFFELSSLL